MPDDLIELHDSGHGQVRAVWRAEDGSTREEITADPDRILQLCDVRAGRIHQLPATK